MPRDAKQLARVKQWQAAHPERHKAAAKRYYARKNYGADLDALYLRQRFCCASCGDRITNQPCRPNSAQVDHDHMKQKGDPGYVRSLLCRHCNSMLGHALDNPDRLRAGITYLEKQCHSPLPSPLAERPTSLPITRTA